MLQSGLGHCVDLYVVMNVLQEHSVSAFIGSWKVEAVCSD
jgi:hypothetical protein